MPTTQNSLDTDELQARVIDLYREVAELVLCCSGSTPPN